MHQAPRLGSFNELTTVLPGGHLYHPHFADEETESVGVG